jgi:hypothetical protein
MIKIKKNLVISTVGDKSLHKYWSKSSKYDTFLIYFGDNDLFKDDSKFYKKAKGYKFHLIKDALEEMPELFNYDYIWLPDDDIRTNKESIKHLFNIMQEYDLEIAQPSIMGYYGVDLTLNQKNSLIRFTNWIEIMCPCFSSDALKKCKESFKENNCGWGIEYLWNQILGRPKNKIAIIDDVIVFHTRPVLTGDTYKNISNPFEFAVNEARTLYKKWDIQNGLNEDKKFGHPIEGEVQATLYKQIFKEMEKGIPKQERIWPKNIIF